MRTMLAAVVFSTVTALSAQGGDADAVMTEMRQALGGAAALDAVQSFSVSGTNTTRGGGIDHSLPFETFALLPDRYMTVRRDWRPGGPLPVEITYPGGVPIVEHRWVFAGYTRQDSFNWPRSLRHVVGGELVEETKFGKFKINPNIKPGKFDIR